jgi:hypothetical protein
MPSRWIDTLSWERHRHWLQAKPGRYGGFKRKISERLAQATEALLAAEAIDAWDLVAVKRQGQRPAPAYLLQLARLDAEARWDKLP